VPNKAYVVALITLAILVSGCAQAKGATQRAEKAAHPLVRVDSVFASGWPAQGPFGPTGATIRFLERGRFSLGLVLQDDSRTDLRLVNAWTLDPPRSMVHFIGARFMRWRRPSCPAHAKGCIQPIPSFPTSTGRDPRPLELGPGRQAAVQLRFEVAACAERPFSPTATRTLAVAYRQDGVRRVEHIDLGAARLRPQPPTERDCRVRPASRLTVTGPFASSWRHTIPRMNTDICHRLTDGALQCGDGDRCAHTASGTLFFRSGVYQSRDKPAIYVSISVPWIEGPCTYPAARVGFTAGIGLHGWTSFAARTSRVTVTHTGRHRFTGRVRATFKWRGHRFHATGIWRCVTGR
jgi:hypothetical protein